MSQSLPPHLIFKRFLRSITHPPKEEPPQYRGSAGPGQVSRTRVPRPRRIRPDGGRTPRRTMPDPRLMLLVCQTLMPDLGRTRPDAAPDAGRRPRTPAGSQPGLPAQGRFLGQGRAAPRTVVLGGVGGIHPSLLAGSRVRGGGGSPAAGGTTVARARRGFREELLDAPCSRLSIVRFDTGPKRSMGHLLGGEKNNFFNSRY